MKRLVALATLTAAAVGCPTPAVTPEAAPHDFRAAHLARLPAETESVAQIDLDRIIDAGRAEAWVARIERATGRAAGSGCLVGLMDRATVITVAEHPGSARFNSPERIVLQAAGNITAADIAACAARLLPELFSDLPDTDEQGRLVLLGDGPTAWIAVDLPEGDVLLGTALEVDQMLARPAPAEGGASPLQAALDRIGPGADLVARFASPFAIPDGPRIDEITVAVHRGTPDRYVVTARMESAEDAAMASRMAVPMAMFSLAMIQGDLARERTRGGIDAELIDGILAVVEALGPVLEAARIETDENRIVATLEADPAKLHPTDLILGIAVSLLVSGSSGTDAPGEPAAISPPDPTYE